MEPHHRATFTIKVKYLTKLTNEIEEILDKPDRSRLDITNAEIRFRDLGVSYEKCADLYESLVDQGDVEIDTSWSKIRNRYYTIAAKIENQKRSCSSRRDSTIPLFGGMGESTFIEKQRLLKLPVVNVPTFDGNSEQWLSYKNTFLNMIDSRVDIDDVVKLTYLRNSLKGEALNKVVIYDLSSENYRRAWETLIDSYDRKRVLISKHLDAIFDIAPLSTGASKELTRLIDDAKQRFNILKSLGVEFADRIAVRLLERVLPSSVRQKWEESLKRNELPSITQFYTFIQDAAAHSFTMETDVRPTSGKPIKESAVLREKPPTKMRKSNDGTRAFVTSAELVCNLCKQPHMLYRCPEFVKLSVPQRWEVVKSAKLCFNCMRSHGGRCELGPCKYCPKRHNSMLHVNSRSSNDSITSSSEKSKGPEADPAHPA